MIAALKDYFVQTKPPALLLMVLLICLIAAFFVKYRRDMAPRMGTLEWIQNYDKPRFTLDGRRYPMEKRDLPPLLILMVVYAVVAFWGLGSSEAPQSFYTFTEESSRVEIDLGSVQEISGVMYYTGLYPGDYDLEYSVNGSNWMRLKNPDAQADENGNVDDSVMPQSYADLFKWQYAKIGERTVRTRYLRVIARELPMELGELALYDENGELMDVTGVDSVLLDEQATVPDSPSY